MTDLLPVDPLIFADGRSYDSAMSNTMREQVKTWLSERGYLSGKASSHKGMNWILKAEKDGVPFSFLIGESQKEPDSLIFLTTVRFSDYQLHIRDLSPEDRRDLLFKLRFRLLQMGVKFDLAEDVSKVNFSQMYFQDEMTRGLFWRTVAEISKAVLCAQWSLEEQFGSFDPSDSNGGGH